MTEPKKVTDDPGGSDSKGAMDDDVQRILDIQGSEVLGHEGEAREEHSGQNSPRRKPAPPEGSADNRPGQIPREEE